MTRRQFNQVFVKLFLPVSSGTPNQNGRVVESWVAKEFKKLGETEYLAITDWVPVCDGLLTDEVVDNSIWDGGRFNGIHYCPVGGDIPQRKDRRLLVNIAGWMPSGCEANITLPDEPGSRAVGPVQVLAGEEQKTVKTQAPLPYVAVIVTPPPLESVTPKRDIE